MHFTFRNSIPKAKQRNFVLKFLKHLVGQESSMKEEKKSFFFLVLDSDENGYIDFVEFLIAVNITSHGEN